MVIKTFFFVRDCPCQSQCSAASWKKAAAWGHSEDECRDRVALHLQKSSLHSMTKEWAHKWADKSQVESYEDEVEEEVHEPARKKSKDHKTTREEKIEAIAHKVVTAIDTRFGSSSAAGATIPSTSVRVGALSDLERSSNITMRFGEVQAAIDCTQRALTAAQQAHRLALAASRAFSDEVSALESVKQNLDAIMATAMAQTRSRS